MYVINARNVNDAYRQGLRLIVREGLKVPSRNGPVLRLPMPVSTVYSQPQERVLFDSTRNANPFFHLFEALWMLNGGNDVATMDGFLKSFKQFSDDGVAFHGAYGHRWRHWLVPTTTYMTELDQIARAIKMLIADRTSRRVVISMWDPARDLGTDSKDIPCNDMIKLSVDGNDKLHMVIFNRSNDVIWGCYGANAVHMSVLHEYVAAMTGLYVGSMTQISCDFHAYLETPYNMDTFVPADLWNGLDGEWINPYRWADDAYALPLVSNTETFDLELKIIMTTIRSERSVSDVDPREIENTFLRDIALPMHRAWECIRRKNYRLADDILRVAQKDLGEGCNDWLAAASRWNARKLET